MNDSPKLLLLASSAGIAVHMGQCARHVGFIVFPGRTQELGTDALERVRPHVALVDIGHEAAQSARFAEVAMRYGVLLVLFASDDVGGHGAHARERYASGAEIQESAAHGWRALPVSDADTLQLGLTKLLQDVLASS